MKIYLLFVYFIIIYSFIIFYILNYPSIHKINILSTYIKLRSIYDSLIIFSCFYDKRYNSIRVIGVSSRKVNFICKYFIENKYEKCNYNYVSIHKDSAGNKFKSRYINILIYTYNYTIPTKIIINNRVYYIINSRNTEKKNVLCITTLKKFVSYNLLSQALKIYNNYGVTDVFIYTSDSRIIFDRLKISNNIVIHVIYIENEFYLNNTFYFGQTVKYNDCLYRNMYESNFIIFADYDELIILNKLNNYNTLLDSLKDGDIYYFRSTICPTSNFVERKNFHIINDTHLERTLNCCMMNSYYHRKYILKRPYKFIKINVHYIDYIYTTCKSVYVTENYAYIHHSRIPTYLLLNHCSKWFNDISLKNLL